MSAFPPPAFDSCFIVISLDFKTTRPSRGAGAKSQGAGGGGPQQEEGAGGLDRRGSQAQQ